MKAQPKRKLNQLRLHPCIEREVIDLLLAQIETYEMKNLCDCHPIKINVMKEYEAPMVCLEHY